MQVAVYNGKSIKPPGLPIHTHSLSDCLMQRLFHPQMVAALPYPGSSSNTHASVSLAGLAEEVYKVIDLQHNTSTVTESEN